MVFGWDDALMIGGSLLSGLGGKSKGEATSAVSGGFDALPEQVKTAYLNTYLPDVIKQYNTPREPIPLVRANEPQSPFDSVELYNLQQFSDAVGGYFSPMGQSLQQTYNPQPAQQTPAANPQQGNIDLARQYMSMLAPGGSRGAALSQLDVNNARQRMLGFDDAKLADIGAMIAANGGLQKAVSAPMMINDIYSQKYGESFF